VFLNDKHSFYIIKKRKYDMDEQSIIISDDAPVSFTQTTDVDEGQEIQTIFLTLNKSSEIIEFN